MTALSRFFCRFLPIFLALFAVLPAQAAFTDNGDGTVTDTITGLMWEKCSWGLGNYTDCTGGTAATFTWTQALGVVATSNTANLYGYADWRLPNKNELESLVKIDASSPAIDTTAFPNTVSGWYWSSTNYAPDPANAWNVSFDASDTGAGVKANTGYVRLVRSGQSFAVFDSQPGIAYSATTFTEAAANDGSISTSITLTLSGDTYVADVVSAGRITASNVPAGLTANFVRTSNTVITATLTGNATNHANDISNLIFTFADGAFTTTGTAANVNGYARNNLVVDFADPPAVAYSATTFTEAAANDGSISTSITMTLSGDTYVADVVSASRIAASNVPAGLTANFVRTSATQITATLTGNATNHANANDISNLTFTFADGAFTNTTAAANVTNYAKANLVVDFADPAAVAYSATTFTEAAANDGSISTSVTLTLSGDTCVADVVSAGRITAGNVPAGLAAHFVRTSNTVITATLTGNATAHANANDIANDIANLTFTFADGAFTNTATAANVTNYAKNNLVVDFADPAAPPPAPVYYDPAPYVPPPPSVINAPSGGQTTLTGTTPITAAPGSTLVIPAGASVTGVAITLAAPAAGVTAQPVTINIGGNILTVTPSGANVVVTLKTVTVNGAPTLVLAVSQGAVTVSAAPGQPLLTVSNSGVVITAGANGGTVAFDGSGAASLSVTSGYVVLSANAFSEAGSNGFAANPLTKDGKLYAGEIAQLDANGRVAQVRLGSLNGSGMSLGDALKPASAAGLEVKAVVPNLKGKAARVSTTQDFTAALSASLGKEFTAQGQNADGVLLLGFPGGKVQALPYGDVTVDTSRADGVTLTALGRAEVATGGVVARFAPAVDDFAQFAASLAKMDKNAVVSVLEDGMVHVRLNGVTYPLQPAWTVSQEQAGQAGLTVDGQGMIVYRDSAGNRQMLYPVFADLPRLIAVFKALDANATAVSNGDGTVSAGFQGKTYTLKPDYRLTTAPLDQAGKAWWQDEDGRVFIRNADGSAQGFAVQ